MKDLFASELRRFRRLTWIFAVGHGLVLLFLSRATNLLQLGYEDHGLMLVLYLLLGLALALVQVGSYRKPSRWLWLIHRPLPPARIFAALTLSALFMLTAVIFVPLLGFVLASDLLTTQVVDSRHYVSLFVVLAFAMMTWLGGAHACVSHHKAAIAVLIAPLLLTLHLASAWWLLLPAFACLLWLAFIVLQGFRADREATIARHGVLLLTALPLQLGFFVLLFHLSKTTIDVAAVMRQSSPGKTILETDVNIEERMRSLGQQFMIDGLKDSADARAASWREQLPLLEVAQLLPDLDRFPVRHQFSNLRVLWWDEKRGTEWTFSHDRMMFHGRDPKSGAERGWWGTRGVEAPERFRQIPLHTLTRDALYAIDDDTQRQHELFRLPPGEWLVSRPTRALDRLLVLTNQRVLALETDRRAASSFAPLLLDWQVALPADAAHLGDISVVELMDGWLVSSFYCANREFDGFESSIEAWQRVVHVGNDGTTSVVGERRNMRGHRVVIGSAPAVPTASWWMSPLLHVLAKWPSTALDVGLTRPPQLVLLPKVPLFHALAVALMLVSLALGLWWLRGANVSAGRRRVWLVSCVALGLPAFLSMICLEPRSPSR